MNKNKINIGIIGAADVIRRSIIEPSKNIADIEIYAIASRSEEKALEFSEKFSIPFYFNNYVDLLNCKDIDAVYIPLINSLHAEWTKKAIEAGKHVLVEKPICMTSSEIEELDKCMKLNPQIIVLEGLMSQYHPFNSKIAEIVQSNQFGKLKSIKTNACYNIDDDKDFRLFPEKGGSVFYEEGLLWCHLTQICVGLKPDGFNTSCEFNGPNGGDHSFCTKLFFKDGITSELFCSYEAPYEANHYIEFEKANLQIRNFWRPTFGAQKLKIKVTIKETSQTSHINFEPENYFVQQLNFFKDLIKGKRKNPTITDAFERIKLMEEIYTAARTQNVLS